MTAPVIFPFPILVVPRAGGTMLWLGLLAGLLVVAAAIGIVRWRTRWIRRRELEIEGAVAEHTRSLEEEKQRAQEATRLKSEFLANMSHEIRTPMNGLLGTLELTLMTELTREQREYLELSRSSAQSLLSLLDDIMDFSRIEAEKLEIDHVPFSISQCIKGAVTTITAHADKKPDIRTDIAMEAPDQLIGDPDRLRQVLVKMIANALKSSPRAGVTVGVRVEAAQSGAPADRALTLMFSVWDSSLGAPSEKREPAAGPSIQADGSLTRKYGGSGLGLEICGRLVGLMGGRIWLDREAGQGNRFCFTARFDLPELNRVAPATLPLTTGRVVKGLRVLLAEDNRVNQIVTSRLLEKHGFHVVVANNGREAVEILRRSPVDLVVMDVQMPEMDGVAATRHIRESEQGTGAHVPILAMTAHAQHGDRDRCLRAGMDGYVAKPVQSDQLYEAIDFVLAKKLAGEPAEQAAPDEMRRASGG